MSKPDILSVSQLNKAAKDLLETYLPLLWVEGELSNLSAPSSGHWYFTLKDDFAQVRCAMFRNRTLGLAFKPQAGEKVLVKAKVSLYEGRGDYQLIVEHIEKAGLGHLQQQFEQLKQSLFKEGLFDPKFKKSLPTWPKRLGVITSPTGAAIKDILHVLKRRFPHLPVLIYPVAVQGKEAPAQIVNALQLANQRCECDVIILGRGGGSIEDLWAFNDEAVARAIFASRIPTVSAVGHEIDFTIADFIADVRAPTPSTAAELISPNRTDVLLRLDQLQQNSKQALKRYFKNTHQQLLHLRARLISPVQSVQIRMQRLDHLEIRQQQSMQNHLNRTRQTLTHLSHRLQQRAPQHQISQMHGMLNTLPQRLSQALQKGLQHRQQKVESQAQQLHNLNPFNTLNRGYAILFDEQGHAITRAEDAWLGQKVQARLHQGRLACEVIQIKPDDPS